jgi:hypothetical protein
MTNELQQAARAKEIIHEERAALSPDTVDEQLALSMRLAVRCERLERELKTEKALNRERYDDHRVRW